MSKKGKVYTCNGCYAFEFSVRHYPIGSPAASMMSEPFCGIGIDIEKKDKTDFRPKSGECPKPKNTKDLVLEKSKFYETCKIV